MAYYNMEVLTFMDETPKSKAIYEYADIDTAKGNAKKDMGSWMLNANCRSIGVIVVNDKFGTVTQDFWERYIPHYTFTVEGENPYSLNAEQGTKTLVMGADGLYDGETLVYECAGVADTPEGEPYAQGATVWTAAADKRVYEVQ